MSSHHSSLPDVAVDPGTDDVPEWARAWARYEPVGDERVPAAISAIAAGCRAVPADVATHEVPVATGNYSTRLHAPVVGDGLVCASRLEPADIRHTDFEVLRGFRELCSKPECSAYWTALEDGGVIER